MWSRLYRGVQGMMPTRRTRSRVIPSQTRSRIRSRSPEKISHKKSEGEIKEDYDNEPVTKKVTKSSNPKGSFPEYTCIIAFLKTI